MKAMKLFVLLVMTGACLISTVLAQEESPFTVQLDHYGWVGTPGQSREDLEEQIALAELNLATEIGKVCGGQGTYYECSTATEKLLLLKLAILRLDRVPSSLTPEEKQLVCQINRNFQERIRSLNNVLHAGGTRETDLFCLRLNALRFQRSMMLLADESTDSLRSIRDQIFQDIQHYIDQGTGKMKLEECDRLMSAVKLLMDEPQGGENTK